MGNQASREVWKRHGSCALPADKATMIWEVVITTFYRYLQWKSVSGQHTDKIFVVEEETMAFKNPNAMKDCNNRNVTRTDQGMVVRIDSINSRNTSV